MYNLAYVFHDYLSSQTGMTNNYCRLCRTEAGTDDPLSQHHIHFSAVTLLVRRKKEIWLVKFEQWGAGMLICLKKSFPILVSERWARSWSQHTGSQPAGDFKPSPGGSMPLLSTRPPVTFPAKGWCQIILFGERGTCAWAACPRMLTGSGLAKIWTRVVSEWFIVKPHRLKEDTNDLQLVWMLSLPCHHHLLFHWSLVWLIFLWITLLMLSWKEAVFVYNR